MIPESLRQIAAVIGTGPAIILCAEFGGTEEYIPKKITDDHKIAQLIGLPAALKLAKEFGGERLDIPRAVAVHRGKRDFKIRAAVAAGASKRKLAREFELTERRIRQITNSGDEDPNQGNLF
ncbi:Mor transcription activator family protein [Sneathiella sp.]|uniref:Mor transcription activator family protein n=1 Tax=Sneathiella sp. TaxID=1964365 RepID=UPI002FE38A79